ncbi:MAG: leucine-rich repeat domain-containing protein [Treponema sp.]|uniref:leucine-rich repeat domain-containing protein n=1 Tax=Treponema sp. TaxID=166 RepID=UPI00298DE3F2|nr:leucine-rich repeat domain-containing protein [Treponema sp.]MBR5933765.1 leucine-rich repeat domain-containing protein [Treponema sp.]
MKIKKHITGFINIQLFLLCTALTVLSCTNFSSSDSGSRYSGKKIKFTGSIVMEDTSGAVPEEIQNLFVSGGSDSSERSATVEPFVYDTTKHYYYAEATLRGKGTKVTDVTWDDSHTTFSMELPDYGTWDVEVGIKYSTENKIIYSSKEPVEIIQGGPTSYSKNFIAKPSQTSDGQGTLKLEMTITDDCSIEFAEISFLNGDSSSWNNKFSSSSNSNIFGVSDSKITLGGDECNLKSGIYTVQINFYDYESYTDSNKAGAQSAIENGVAVLVYSTIQTLNIYDNLTTNRWFCGTSDTIPNATPIGVDGPGTFKLSQDFLNHYVLTNICVASNGSDSNFGTVYNPYKTLDKAISYINERGSSSNDFTISVSGDVECNTEISLATTKAKTLTIKGKSGSNANDKLNGKSNGRVLKLNTGITVTIENLTITGGDAKTGSDDDMSGGGIYLANGTLKLGDGAKISGNHAAAFGGGVYVASGTKLFMYGSSLIGDTIQATATSSTLTSSGTTGCANAAVGGGGGLYNNGGEVYIGYNGLSGDTPQKSDMTSGYGVRRNYSERTYGGGICNRKGTLIIASGSVSYNQCVGGNGTAGAGGGIFNAYESTPATSLTIEAPANTSNKFVMYGNKAVRGGAICNNTDGVITIKAGQIGGSASNLQNTATENGGAVYHGGKTLSVSGTALIYTGSEKTNDVYLPSGNTIYVSGSLNETNVATVTPANYKRGTDILSVASSVTINDTLKSKFNLSADNDGWERKDKTVSGNKYVYITSPIYVVDSTDSGNTRPTGFNKGLSTGANGTKTSPYASIAAAAQASDLSEAGGKITIAGTLTGTQTISSVTNGVSSVTLAGYNTNATINGNANGSALTISVAKTFTIQQLQITNGKASAGGGINITSGSDTVVNLDSDAKVYSNKATSGGTGAGVYVASGATLNIKSGSLIYSNSAYTGNINGAGVYNAGTVDMTGGSVYSNSAYQGGGIYNAGSLSMTGGEIGKTSYYNSSSNAGGAIYNKGSATLDNSISIPYGGSAASNDIAVYYDTSLTPPALKMISAGANLSASNIALTPTSWIRGKQILTGTAGKYSCFKMTDTEWSIISSSTSSTHAGKIDADIYVAPTGSTTIVSSVTYGKGATPANGGRGTKAKPYSTITDAVAQCWGGPKDKGNGVSRTINIVGSVSGAHTIPDTLTASQATAILLKGINSDATLNGGFSSQKEGTTLTISTLIPVTIQTLKITGGYTSTGYGGGINVPYNKGLKLTLTTGAKIIGNTAKFGGGISVYGYNTYNKATLIMNSTAEISGNTATDSGGGVKIYCCNFYMYGSALIGDTSGNSNATSGSKSNMAYDNNSTGSGGGLSTSNDCEVWIGYNENGTASNMTSGYGIRHNFAYNSGGGIYGYGSIFHINSGEVSFNGTRLTSPGKGGGIYYNKNGTNTLTISGNATLQGNKSYEGGGVYAATAAVTISGGTIKNNTAQSAGGAVFANDNFTLSGSVSVPFSGSAKSNDVFLASGKTIELTGNTLSNHSFSDQIGVSVTSGISTGDVILSGDEQFNYTKALYKSFKLSSSGYYINEYGKYTEGYFVSVANLADTISRLPSGNKKVIVEGEYLTPEQWTALKGALQSTSATRVNLDLRNTTVDGVPNSAFYNCTKLGILYLPDTANRIYDYAFYGCSNLTGVYNTYTLSSITDIGEYAFAYCSSLTRDGLYMGSDLETFYSNSFIGVNISMNVTTSGTSYFNTYNGANWVTFNGRWGPYFSLDTSTLQSGQSWANLKWIRTTP